jgi:hypothetical protein
MINKLEKYLEDNLHSEEGYERGETNIYWKDKQINWEITYKDIAKDIINFLKN